VVVCGVTTEICVESTIRDAFFRDYRIVVPSDAVAAIDPVRHEGTLRTISYGFGTVTTTGAVLKALTGVLVG
jgi:ureidoacrylate peracid hydrolase